MSELAIKLKIIEIVIRLDTEKGHLKWSITQVSKLAKVSRSLVYYHFGKTKNDILLECLSSVLTEFYGLTDERMSLAKASLSDSLKKTHAIYMRNPSFAIFFQKWRNKPSKIRDKYIEIEELYDKKLSVLFPRANPHQRKAIHAFFHGLVTAPYVDEKTIDECLGLLKLKELVGE